MSDSLPPASHDQSAALQNQQPNQPMNQVINAAPRTLQLDARMIYSVLKTADEQRQKATRQPELQQFLSLVKADTEGKLVTVSFQSNRVVLPIDSPASHDKPEHSAVINTVVRPPSPRLNAQSSAESTASKKKGKKTKEKETKEKNDKKRKKDKEKNNKKDKNRDSDSDDSGSDSDKPSKDSEKKKKDKKPRKKHDSSDEPNSKKQRTAEPVSDANALQSMEEGAAAARTATTELVTSTTLAQNKLAAVDSELLELQAATKAKLAQLNNSEEHRRLSEQAAIQAEERAAAKAILEKTKKQMIEKERALLQLRTQRDEIERQERAIMTDKLKQSEFFLSSSSVHARFTWAANNESINPTNQSSNPSSPSMNNSTSSSPPSNSFQIIPPEERNKLADENVLQLVCLACQTHLRNFIDSMMVAKRKRLEEPIKQSIDQSKNLRLHQPNDDMVDTIRKIELKKELYWEKVAALREAKMKGVDPVEAERAFDQAHQSVNQSTSQASPLKKRGTEPHLLTVLDFTFALENDRLVNQSNAHTGRLASVHARLPHRIKEWPAEFQPPHPIIRNVTQSISRPSNMYGSNSMYGSSNYNASSSFSSQRPTPQSYNASNAPSPASTTQSDDLDALMDMDAGD